MWHEVRESQIKCGDGNQQLRTTTGEASVQYTIGPLSGQPLQPLDARNCANSAGLSDLPEHSNMLLPMTMTASRFLTMPSLLPSTIPAHKELYALRPLQSPGDMRLIHKPKRLHPIHTLLKEVAIVLNSAHTTTGFLSRIHGKGKEKHVSTLQALLGTPRFSPPFFEQPSSLIRKSTVSEESQVTTVCAEKRETMQSTRDTKDSEDIETGDSKNREARRARGNTKPRAEFRCSMCEQAFVQKGRLFNHVRVVHERQRAYKCPHRCGQTFGAKGDLTRHVRSIHEGRRPFRCNSCGAAFSRKSVLVRHCSKVHTKSQIVVPVSQADVSTHAPIHIRKTSTRHSLAEKRISGETIQEVQDLQK